MSGPELKADYIERLGAELGAKWFEFKNDFHNLQLEWQLFHAFFATNKERVELLNSASGKVARILKSRC